MAQAQVSQSALIGGSVRLVMIALATLLSMDSTLQGESAQVPVGADTAKHAAQEDDIREAIFRFEMKDRSGVIFLEINRRDPSDSFMKRFSGVKVTIKKSSAIAREKRLETFIHDRETGETGTCLWVGKIAWRSARNVVVEGGHYCGSRCAASGDFHVALEGGKWIVEKFEVKTIS